MNTPSAIGAEFVGLSLGDVRLERRARLIVCKAAMAPATSFPSLLPTSAELEGAYRFFQNDDVAAKALLNPHVQASLARVRGAGAVRIVHDTTGMSFGGKREGLGTLGSGGCGFWAHFALAVSADEDRAVLGVMGLQTKVYPTLEEKARRHQRLCHQWKKDKKKKRFPRVPVLWSGRDKWCAIPLELQMLLRGVEAVHVMDQEADNFEVFQTLSEAKLRFVIRGSSARRVHSTSAEAPKWVHTKLAEKEVRLTRRVSLNARPKGSECHARRDERAATLSIRAARVSIVGPEDAQLKLNAVEVIELKPPPGEEPVNWVLFTTEPINTVEQIAAVVDHYRARWRIEEFFKALKTGCAIEKRQLTDYDALMRALALYTPIAWHLLALRTEACRDKPIPATRLLTPVQLVVLRALLNEQRQNLAEEASASDALFAIAALGGHLKRNGDPGWITLGRGYHRLLEAEAIWTLASRTLSQSDES